MSEGARLVLARARFHLQRLGWPGMAGLALLAGAAAVQWLGVDAARARLAQSRSELASWQARAVQAAAGGVADEGARLAAFSALLPAADALPGAVERIHAAAQARGVRLDVGEYKTVREAGGAPQRYQLSLPARGDYPQVRAWLADVMNALPAAALDEISIRRDNVGAQAVEARVRLTVYFRAQ